jgi:hypothetical protein
MAEKNNQGKSRWRWDPHDVWRRLVRGFPVSIEDTSATTGRMVRRNAKMFWASIAEFPDPLQDILFVIAHQHGYEVALIALDRAIGEHLADCKNGKPVVVGSIPPSEKAQSRPGTAQARGALKKGRILRVPRAISK